MEFATEHVKYQKNAEITHIKINHIKIYKGEWLT